jgi:ribonuclease HIII
MVSILRQRVILGKDGKEKKLEDLDGPMVSFDKNEVVDLRNPETNELLGVQVSAGEIMAGVHSWVMQQLLKFDQQQAENSQEQG